ncbi:MAG: helix-turn-helix transcriptional regulator [Cyanobacteria bacterium REEB446]|nr:helix-turn-helix transcriptional regulator [Cyanobacteria bacterium REEB446]
MLSLDIPSEILLIIAKQARELRLEKNLTQEGLAKRSGVSLASIKRFERLGKISLESLLEIALVLGVLDEFKLLFRKLEKPLSMAELLKEPKKRKRGSIL